jgi:CRISPR-associated protein Cmr6
MLRVPLQALVEGFNERGQGARNLARDLLRFHHERLERALQHWSRYAKRGASRTLRYRVTWRLTLGLGLPSPTENGFVFDPLIGVPYIPGSAVKGLCRRTATVAEMDATEWQRLFGPEQVTADTATFQGSVVFLDAYPSRWPRLAVDVVNCHHPTYYRDQGKSDSARWPSETESPVPVFSLTVDHNTEFTFRLAGQEADLVAMTRLLAQGLDWLGIGAKTAVGYGTMQPVTETP